MTRIAGTARRFRVHVRHLDRHHARYVEESSFEAAAIAFLEDGDLPLAAESDGEIRVIVHDIASGHEHCFRLDIATGLTAPCG